MRPFETLDRVTTPEGRELSLHHHDGHYFIHLDGEELMSTWVHGSESALAEMTCRDLAGTHRPRILIGGLGLGFTLRAALEVLPRNAEVVVAELFPQVVEWHRTHLVSLGRPMEDRRARIHDGDVVGLLRDSPSHHYHCCAPGCGQRALGMVPEVQRRFVQPRRAAADQAIDRARGDLGCVVSLSGPSVRQEPA